MKAATALAFKSGNSNATSTWKWICRFSASYCIVHVTSFISPFCFSWSLFFQDLPRLLCYSSCRYWDSLKSNSTSSDFIRILQFLCNWVIVIVIQFKWICFECVNNQLSTIDTETRNKSPFGLSDLDFLNPFWPTLTWWHLLVF